MCNIYVRRMMCCNQERSVSYIPFAQKERRGELMVCFVFVFSYLRIRPTLAPLCT